MVKTYDHTSGTWQDLPPRYDASTGMITAEISHFCCIALFIKSLVTANSPVKVATPVPGPMQAPPETPPPPGTAMNIFINMMAWAKGLVVKKYLPARGSWDPGDCLRH